MTSTLLWSTLTDSHEWSISLVSASSWFAWRLTSSLLVDLASVAFENPLLLRAQIFLVDLYLSLSRWWPLIWTRQDWLCCHLRQWTGSKPVEVVHVVHQWPCVLAFSCLYSLTGSLPWLRHFQYSSQIPHQLCVMCHSLHEHFSIVAKCLASIRFSKCLNGCMAINQDTRLQVSFGTSDGVLSPATKMLHSSACGVEFITPPGLASDSVVSDSSCFRMFTISTVRPAASSLHQYLVSVATGGCPSGQMLSLPRHLLGWRDIWCLTRYETVLARWHKTCLWLDRFLWCQWCHSAPCRFCSSTRLISWDLVESLVGPLDHKVPSNELSMNFGRFCLKVFHASQIDRTPSSIVRMIVYG